MKMRRLLLILSVMAFALIFATGCRCVPSDEQWFLYSYKDEIEFIGGIKLDLGFSSASHAYPFAGIKSEDTAISFSKDGSVVFTDVDGVTHRGTFTYEHQGLNYTSFTITLENGEVIKGDSIAMMDETKLALTYKDVIYNFTAEDLRTKTTIDDVIQMIVSGDIGSLNEAEVVKTEKGHSVVFSEMVSYPITEKTAVYAIKINADGTYEILDKVLEGKALSTYNNAADYIVIYYVE